MSSTYFKLSNGDFGQDWSDTGLITANDDWANVPSIVGYLGNYAPTTAPTNVNPTTLTAPAAVDVDVIANQSNPNTNISGGVAEFEIANPTVALQGSGTADAPYLALFLDATGRENLELSFRLRDIDGSGDNAAQQIAVQYRIGDTDAWTNVPGGYYADVTTGPGLAEAVTDVRLTLPSAVNGQAQVQVRIITTNAAGNDEWVGVDDIAVTSREIPAVQPGALSVADASVVEGQSGEALLRFVVRREGGDDGAVSATWTAGFGSADAADFAPGAAFTGTVAFADGQTEAVVELPVRGDLAIEPDEIVTVSLSAPTGGASLGDAEAVGTILNDDFPTSAPGVLSIADASATEGNAGETAISFTVTRADGSDGAVSATWSATFGSADTADFAAGAAFTGAVSFAEGQTSATVTLPVRGDLIVEADESFTVTLSAPTGGAALGDAEAVGTIRNDDLPPLANVFINEIHYDNAGTDVGEAVEVAGVAGTDLTGWSLVFYNGNGGASYATVALSGVIDAERNGFGARSFAGPAGGIQNGAPDGVALVDNFGRVVQFLSYEGEMTATNGPAAGLTSTDIGVAEEPAPGVGLSLQLTGAGSSAGDFAWAANADDSFGDLNAGQTFIGANETGRLSVSDARVAEGDAGTSELVFTVRRAGGFANAASVDYAVDLNGTADAADLAAGATLSGVVTFAAGEFVKQVRVAVAGDLAGERNETLTLRLGATSGDVTVTRGEATGVIVNDDPLPLRIGEIQGEGHRSDYVGQTVVTSGVVTALRSNGFFIQDVGGDGNARTSDAVFVFTGSAPTVAAGDALSVQGVVDEFRAGTGGLTVTQIQSPAITVESTGNALPAATLIGVGGLLPPTDVIDDDRLTSYDPATDGIDFWESLEGMRVTIDRPLVVSNTGAQFGETDVVASLGQGATGVNDRGGITISPGDYNPEKIQIDSDSAAYAPNHSIGDELASVTGVVNYAAATYEVLVTEAVAVTEDVQLQREATTLTGDANHLSIATYNVENLDPTDTKFDILAGDIVYSLGSPDIVALQEIQDADGAGNGPNLSGTVTAQKLIDAIAAAGGGRYAYVEVAPDRANSTGGEPGGNIRSGFLYNLDRVTYVDGSAQLITGPAYEGSRRPLVADFQFNGQTVTAINVHFTSRGGSDPLFGATQPPADAGDASRTAQAAGVKAFVTDILAADPTRNVAVLGDFNGFYFEDAQLQLTDPGRGGVFTNLNSLLPEEERYSYLFGGNAQAIDHILVTPGLLTNARFDAVHINSQFTGDRGTDHDPQLAVLRVAATPTDLALSGGAVAENLAAGAVAGTLSARDTAGDTLTYKLVDDAGGLFAVDAATGVVTTTAALDHEATGAFTIVAEVTDGVGLTQRTAFEITVADINEGPTAVRDTAAVDEDASTANLWSTLLGNDTDPDRGDALSIRSVDTTGLRGSVVFDPATQTLRYVADADLFDALLPGQTVVERFTYTTVDKGGLTSTAAVEVTVTGVFDTEVRFGGNGSDALTTGGGEDFLYGGNGNDVLRGMGGHDVLSGGNGADMLDGGSGGDLLMGGAGTDRLTGGAGEDSFLFARGGGSDTVTDFDTASDRLLLDRVSVARWSVGDVDRDGVKDLTIAFTNGGGQVTLLGVSDFGQVDVTTPFHAAVETGVRIAAEFDLGAGLQLGFHL